LPGACASRLAARPRLHRGQHAKERCGLHAPLPNILQRLADVLKACCCDVCWQAHVALRPHTRPGYRAAGRGTQVAVVQFASEARVELPLQAAETAAFQACVSEMVRGCLPCQVGLGLSALRLRGVHGARMLRPGHARLLAASCGGALPLPAGGRDVMAQPGALSGGARAGPHERWDQHRAGAGLRRAAAARRQRGRRRGARARAAHRRAPGVLAACARPCGPVTPGRRDRDGVGQGCWALATPRFATPRVSSLRVHMLGVLGLWQREACWRERTCMPGNARLARSCRTA